MRVMTSWAYRVKALLTAAGSRNGMRVYLFGSALTHVEPTDIDLLIVYSQASFGAIREFRKAVDLLAQEELGLAVDWVTLSVDEEHEVQFIATEGAVQLSPVLPDSVA